MFQRRKIWTKAQKLFKRPTMLVVLLGVVLISVYTATTVRVSPDNHVDMRTSYIRGTPKAPLTRPVTESMAQKWGRQYGIPDKFSDLRWDELGKVVLLNHTRKKPSQHLMVLAAAPTTKVPVSGITPPVNPPSQAPPSSSEEIVHHQPRTNKNGTWVAVNGFLRVFLYSAYFDDRDSLQTLPMVRIILVSEVLDKVPIYCVLQYSLTKEYLVEGVPLPCGIGVAKGTKTFREYVLTCPLDSAAAPKQVGVTFSRGEAPTSFISVTAPEKPKEKEKFALCVPVAFGELDPYQIIEWMEFLQILGVSHVTLYNNSLSDEASRVIDYYVTLGLVDYRQSYNFIQDGEKSSVMLQMSPTINDCMYRNMHKYENIIVTDLDEIIIPHLHMNYADMLRGINEKQTLPHPARSYSFRNKYFFRSFPPDGTQPNLVTLRHRLGARLSAREYSIKSIVKPEACTNMHNHKCWGFTRQYVTEGHTVDVVMVLGMNHHYKKCHLDFVEGRDGACQEALQAAMADDRVLIFKDQLVKRVSRHLRRLKMNGL